MVVQHNMSAGFAQRSLNIVGQSLEKSTEKLSSGYRINRAGDDAAGLSISEKMRWQIRGLDKASQNGEDGLSLLQTADGALDEIQQIVQRMRELSVQAANDTNTVADRAAVQSEIDELRTEINRVADGAEFNTKKLLDGTLGTTSPNISYATNTYKDTMASATADSGMQLYTGGIVVNPVVVGSGVSNAAPLTAMLKEEIVPQAANSLKNAFPLFATKLANGQISSKIGLKIYDDPGSSTLASVSMKYSWDTSGQIDGSQLQLSLGVNVETLKLDASGNITATNGRTDLETTIVHEMMHAFMDDTLTNGMIGATNGVIDSSNKFPLWFAEGMAQTAAGGCSNGNDWVNGGLRLDGQSSLQDITSTVQSGANSLSSGTTASQYGTGYLACMYLGYMAAGNPATINSSNIAGGLNTILTKLEGGQSLNDVINDISNGKYTSTSDFQKKFGDTESAQFIHELLVAVGSAGNGGVIKSLTDYDLLPDSKATSAAYGIVDTDEFTTTSVDPQKRNWATGGSGGTGPVGNGDGFHLQIGSLNGQDMTIFIRDSHTRSMSLDNMSVDSYEHAGAAIESCDTALSYISENRSQIGAYMNRLEHVIANLDNGSENTQTAESRIRDTDMSEELVLYTTMNILQQSGQAILAQANHNKDGVLGLLE